MGWSGGGFSGVASEPQMWLDPKANVAGKSEMCALATATLPAAMQRLQTAIRSSECDRICQSPPAENKTTGSRQQKHTHLNFAPPAPTVCFTPAHWGLDREGGQPITHLAVIHVTHGLAIAGLARRAGALQGGPNGRYW